MNSNNLLNLNEKMNKGKSKSAIYPGTFNTFHLGHIDIVKRSLKLFDNVIILVANNFNKPYTDISIRFNNVNNIIKQHFKLNKRINIKVNLWEGLLVDYVKKNHIYNIIRGIRNLNDFKYEAELYKVYKKQLDKIEVIYFIANQKYLNISSSNLSK